jgi:hypothetical protein
MMSKEIFSDNIFMLCACNLWLEKFLKQADAFGYL